jgi:hypothetical protein
MFDKLITKIEESADKEQDMKDKVLNNVFSLFTKVVNIAKGKKVDTKEAKINLQALHLLPASVKSKPNIYICIRGFTSELDNQGIS